jgi:hypothetical protein
MNKIKDKYIDSMLVERRVNGYVEPVVQIQNDQRFNALCHAAAVLVACV